MKVLSANEIRQWDQYTIAHEPIASIDLMERAAAGCMAWLSSSLADAESFIIFCGKGNNGGDGLAIARLLAIAKYKVCVYILEFGHKGTADFQTNLARLHAYPEIDIRFIQTAEHFPSFTGNEIIIDALFGSGLNRRLEGVTANLVEHINHGGCKVVSIDIPSGMFVDRSSLDNMIIKASHTLSFECFKTALLVPENADFTGIIHLLPVGLHPDYYNGLHAQYELIDLSIIRSIQKPRKSFAHKGNFGHALLLAGSYGKIGACILAAKACLRSGVGLLSCHIPACGYTALQTAVPEAMAEADEQQLFSAKMGQDTTIYDAIGIGPGIGTAQETKMLLREIFDSYRAPIVLDADALNIMAGQKDLLQLIPAGSILTPHPKEFERLFGKSNNDFDRIALALQKAKELQVLIILKGHYTLIATSDKGFFNPTGNPGMATGGSGDVLTGILTGLLAQGYSSVETALLGVYLHGLAGDIAARKNSMEAMIAGDIIENMGDAFGVLQNA